ncbi:MAG: hypothetical protein MUF52_10495 [Syntrophobacteraceae bacterium]|jgi:hypothetical protein|nr:hypothetical protein [Syntrophobacteraceae bacterium]
MRKCHLYFMITLAGLLLVAAMAAHSVLLAASEEARLRQRAEWVARLGLSDLCLFTDARYARHPVMADLHTPFQDYPFAFEHFPSGSILGVPPHLRGVFSWRGQVSHAMD